MKHMLLVFLLFFSVGLLQANDKKVIIKKMVVSSDQVDKNVDVNVEVENDQLTLTINKDGEENVFKVNLQDEDALKALKEEIEALGVDVKIMGLVDGDEDHEIMFFGDDYDKFSFEPEFIANFCEVSLSFSCSILRFSVAMFKSWLVCFSSS